MHTGKSRFYKRLSLIRVKYFLNSIIILNYRSKVICYGVYLQKIVNICTIRADKNRLYWIWFNSYGEKITKSDFFYLITILYLLFHLVQHSRDNTQESRRNLCAEQGQYWDLETGSSGKCLCHVSLNLEKLFIVFKEKQEILKYTIK